MVCSLILVHIMDIIQVRLEFIHHLANLLEVFAVQSRALSALPTVVLLMLVFDQAFGMSELSQCDGSLESC